MSDNWIQFVPADPNAQPTAGAADRAIALLAGFAPEADKVTAEFKDAVEPFHPGGNWSGVNCPGCGKDAENWWGDAMEDAAAGGFADLSLTAPCCGVKTSLDALHYPWQMAFGRFVLEAMNPNIGDTTPDQDKALEACLGLPLRKVLLHI